MGNSPATARAAGVPQATLNSGTLPDYDENIINRGTPTGPKPQLKFHQVCGTNIHLQRDGRVARRRESFCKGLAFSNRPISIDEIVCIRLCEVGTNWSGVMRFGVTTVDPASFRDIELPKFACPDLTSKGGYWAKSLAERYSVEGTILHFFVNENGEMYYGVNGTHKGLFLSGINVLTPLWIIVDIYGNSIAVEFIDPNDVQLQRRTPSKGRTANISLTAASDSNEGSPVSLTRNTQRTAPPATQTTMTASTSANNLLNATNSRSTSSRASPLTNNSSKMRFHSVKGVNVNLQHDDTVAVRKHGEYYLGYVFTERPMKIGEKLVVLVSMVEDAFSGSLAFGLTSCDPTQVPASRLPVDSDELLERPEYWVCIKDVAAMPQAGDKLSFQVDAAGRVIFAKNDAPQRVIMHVDVSIPLWAFFDLYGSTRKIQILDFDHPCASLNPADLTRSYRAASEGACSQTVADRSSAAQLAQARLNRPSSTQWNMDSLRVALPAESSSASAATESLPMISTSTSNPSHLSAASTAGGTSSSAPSGNAPFSYLNMDAAELAKIRANIALRRMNITTGQQSGSTPPTSTASLLDQPTSYQPITTTASATASNNDSPLLSRTPPSLTELLANRRSQLETRLAALTALREQREAESPPYMPTYSTQAQQRNNAFTDVIESNSSISGASITVPLLPPPLFSSLEISSGRGAARATRRSYLLDRDLDSSSDSSPNREEDANRQTGQQAANEQQGGEGANECSICMNSRVNAVIYRCGHMCMCFPCAKETHRRSGDCPICRTPISMPRIFCFDLVRCSVDVIRCYPV